MGITNDNKDDQDRIKAEQEKRRIEQRFQRTGKTRTEPRRIPVPQEGETAKQQETGASEASERAEEQPESLTYQSPMRMGGSMGQSTAEETASDQAGERRIPELDRSDRQEPERSEPEMQETEAVRNRSARPVSPEGQRRETKQKETSRKEIETSRKETEASRKETASSRKETEASKKEAQQRTGPQREAQQKKAQILERKTAQKTAAGRTNASQARKKREDGRRPSRTRSAQARRRTSEKRRRGGGGVSRKKLLLLLLLLLLFVGGGVVILQQLPSNEWVTVREYFQLTPDVSYGLTVNSEIVAAVPVKVEGGWYLDLNTTNTYVSSKFYFDGEELLFTDPYQTYQAAPGEYFYQDEGELTYQLEYRPCLYERNTLYVSLEYMKLMEGIYYQEEEKQCIWVWNNWNEVSVASVQKNGAIRSGTSHKEPIIVELEKGSQVLVLSQEVEGWSRVQDVESSWIGYLPNQLLSEVESVTAAPPDGRVLITYSTQQLEETVVMGWHQVFTESGLGQLEEILAQADGMNVICPTWFTIQDNEGNLQSLADKEYVEQAHEAGVLVWGMVENINIEVDEAAIFQSTQNRRNLISQLMEQALEYELDGINVDVENLSSDLGLDYLQFIRELSAACRKNRLTLSVDNYSPMPHTAHYDRTEQAQVVDYVIVMAYDEHYAGGDTAGSTSSLSWVNQSAERTLLEVPKEKLIVGLPFYSRLWCQASDGSLTSEGLGMEGMQNVVKEHGLSMTWLEEEGQNYVEYEEDGNQYSLWIEDARSLRLKLNTAFHYEPAGVAFFKLNLETEDVWAVIREFLQ